MDPMEIFPEEVWEHIFGQIEDSQDWLNLFRSSPSFERVVGGKHKSAALLPQVFGILSLRSKGGINLKNIQLLRLISCRYTKVIDRMLEAHLLHLKESLIPTGFINHFRRTTDITRCLQHFAGNDQHHGTTFLGGVVELEYPLMVRKPANPASDRWFQLDQEYKHYVNALLHTFGAKICRLKLYITLVGGTGGGREEGLRGFVNTLQYWIPRLSGLKQLEVLIGSEGGDANYSQTSSVDWKMEPFPVPELFQLETFNFSCMGRGRWAEEEGAVIRFQNALLSMHPKPDVLTKAAVLSIPADLQRFPKLGTLEVKNAGFWDIVGLSWKSFPWPLKCLRLQCYGGSSFPLRFLIIGVNKFSSTLTALQLQFSFGVLRPPRSRLPLILPILKKLALEIDGLYTLDPFAKLPQLEHLLVKGWNPQATPPSRSTQQVVKTLGFEKRMYESNIWSVFPKLKRFEFHSTINNRYSQPHHLFVEKSFDEEYYREEYELELTRSEMETVYYEMEMSSAPNQRRLRRGCYRARRVKGVTAHTLLLLLLVYIIYSIMS